METGNWFAAMFYNIYTHTVLIIKMKIQMRCAHPSVATAQRWRYTFCARTHTELPAWTTGDIECEGQLRDRRAEDEISDWLSGESNVVV